MKVVLDDNTAKDVGSTNELDAILDAAAARARSEGRRIIAQLTHDNGCILAIGLGGEESVLCFFEDGDGPSYTSVGRYERDGEPTIFEFAGDVSEIFPAMMITNEASRNAARHFFATGERAPSVRWDKDWA